MAPLAHPGKRQSWRGDSGRMGQLQPCHPTPLQAPRAPSLPTPAAARLFLSFRTEDDKMQGSRCGSAHQLLPTCPTPAGRRQFPRTSQGRQKLMAWGTGEPVAQNSLSATLPLKVSQINTGNAQARNRSGEPKAYSSPSFSVPRKPEPWQRHLCSSSNPANSASWPSPQHRPLPELCEP